MSSGNGGGNAPTFAPLRVFVVNTRGEARPVPVRPAHHFRPHFPAPAPAGEG